VQHYYHPQSRAVTTDWMLAELEAPHEQIIMDFTSGESQKPEFLAVNPMGKIPTLVDEGIVVTEAAAICAYLADKYPEKGMAPPLDSPQRGRYYRYLFYPGSALEPMFTFNQIQGVDLSAQSVGWGDHEHCLNTIESMTPDSAWALGEQFSTADIVFGGTLDFAAQFGWLTSPSEKVAQYIKRLKSRPAYRATHDAAWH